MTAPPVTRVVAPGSSVLCDADRDHYGERFGERFTHVQWQPAVPSRAERRRAARKQRLTGSGRRRQW